MKRILLILIVIICSAGKAKSQAFTIDELISLTSQSSKNINHFLSKKGFTLHDNFSDSNEMKALFVEKTRWNKKETVTGRSIEMCLSTKAKCFTLHTTRVNEFNDFKQRLIKSGFYYDSLKNNSKASKVLFQRSDITVEVKQEVQDNIPQYSFALTQKIIPSELKYAEDLLMFDSHELLVSYFGERNVKRDMYYLTEKELKKCSVLFSGTPRQVVFVWNNENYLNKLFYIIITNHLPTKGGENSNPLAGNNRWELKNGIYPGMPLKDLLRINEVDFEIYGNKSELSFLIKPNQYGKVDFKKTAIMLSCHGCYNDKIFNQNLVSALDVAKYDLPIQVFDVVLYASVN